jgi:hypothetical protein
VNRAHLNTNDRFSMALARLAADRILEEPERIRVALSRFERWRKTRGGITSGSAEWERLIHDHTPQEIAALLVEDSQEGQRRRSSHPFIQPPFFTEQERLTLIATIFHGGDHATHANSPGE